MIKEEPTGISESLQIKEETSSTDAEIKQKPQDTKQEPQLTKQEPQQTKQEPQQTKQEPQQTKQEPQQTKQEPQQTKIELQDSAETVGAETDSDDKAEKFSRISAHPDFLCVAQFIGTFGGLLGIPQFFIDTIEDGLNSSNTDISDEYVKGNF